MSNTLSHTVENKLFKLKLTKSTRLYGFHPRALSETTPILSDPLSIIFKKPPSENHLPKTRKGGNITAIHKKLIKTTTEDYRPTTTHTDNILNHTMNNNLFGDAQYGFMPGRSCMTQFVITIEKYVWISKRRLTMCPYKPLCYSSHTHVALLAKLMRASEFLAGWKTASHCEWQTIRLDRDTEWYCQRQYFGSHLIRSVY